MISVDDLERRAKTWAKWWHTGQYRKYTNNTVPYYLHPGAVAWIVKSVPHTPEMIAAAWMHDTLEDTDATEEEMRREFGDVVTDYVVWLTDVSKPGDGNRVVRKRLDREHIAMAPPEVKTVKLADLIDNSKDILANDPGFARISLREKRLLLDYALKEGDQTLWKQADEIVTQGSHLWQRSSI